MFLSNLFGSFRRTAGKPARRPQRRAFRPHLEQLEGRLVPAGFVWQNAWDVSPLAEGSTAFGNIGAAGDEGPASAAASAYAFSSGDHVGVSVSFQRTFQLAGSPTGWKVTLDGLLSGSLYARGNFDDTVAFADVNADVHIFQADAPGSVIDLYFGVYGYGYGYPNGTPNVWVPGTQQGLIPDGTYTVWGWLGAGATGCYSQIDGDGQAWSDSYLVTTIDAVPWDNRPAVSISDATFVEGNTGAVTRSFTVALAQASDQTVTVDFALADDSATLADKDYGYLDANRTVTFAPGVTQQTIAVQIYGDRKSEPNETFSVNLSNPTNVRIEDGQAVGTILDDEPRISISDVAKKEGNGKKTTLFVFTVTLSVAYDEAVTMSYSTVNGTATTSDSDYIAKTGTLTFAPGETTKTITIEVKGDTKKEADETFYLDLFGNSSNSLFTKNRGLGTILNDD